MTLLCSLLASATLLAFPTPDVKADLNAFADLCGALGWSGTMYVERSGEVFLAESRGLADVDAMRVLEPDDAMEIASITKVITAVAVAHLHQEKKLDLDQPIGTYIEGVSDAHGKITVRHLLSHSSGMGRMSKTGHGDDRAAAIAGYLQDPPGSTPGTATEYWNGGYALLAAIVEEVTGETFEAYVKEHIFEPAGMESACFVGEPLEPERQAMGYELSSRSRWAASHPYPSGGAWSYKGMGGAVCTAKDLARFARAFASGKLVEKPLVKEMTTPAFEHQGLGWKLAAKGEPTKWSHGGDVAGFHSKLEYLPDEDLVVVVMGNRSGPPQYTVSYALMKLAQGEGQLGWFPKALPWMPKDWKSLEGDWTIEEDERPAVRIEVSDCVRMIPITEGATEALGPPSSKARAMDSFPPRAKNALEPEAFLRLVPVGDDKLQSRPWKPTEMPHRVQLEREGTKVIRMRIERLRSQPVTLTR